MPQRILITGAGGMVGSYATGAFQGEELILTDIVPGFEPLDIRDPEQVRRTVVQWAPDVVLHLAAATDVDRCETDPDWAYQTNALGTQNVALACQASGAVMVYISTAGVFWGDKPEPYIEYDVPRPANLYGQSKLAGEQIVARLLSRFYIVRAGWMIGGGERDKKFVGKIARLIQSGPRPLPVVNDKFGTPTFAKDLLAGIRRLVATGYFGLYHMANQGGVCSRYDIALTMREIMGRRDVAIVPVGSDRFPLPAPRARSEAMRNLNLDLLGLNMMRPWQDALREYLRQELWPTLEGAGQAPLAVG